jgi:glycerol-3-phosphate acyltransferase PlsY
MNSYLVPGIFVIGYLIGSIPFGYLIAKARGVDILSTGSGSPGATNVKRVISKGAGNLCFVLDALKGFISAGWPVLIFASTFEAGSSLPGIAGFLGAIIGHSFSVFLKFRGGKGVATTMGGLLALMPLVLILGIAVWLVVFYSTHYVSLGSLCFGITLPLSSVLMGLANEEIGLAAFLGLLIVVRHHANIRRLLAGTENRFTKGEDSKRMER